MKNYSIPSVITMYILMICHIFAMDKELKEDGGQPVLPRIRAHLTLSGAAAPHHGRARAVTAHLTPDPRAVVATPALASTAVTTASSTSAAGAPLSVIVHSPPSPVSARGVLAKVREHPDRHAMGLGISPSSLGPLTRVLHERRGDASGLRAGRVRRASYTSTTALADVNDDAPAPTYIRTLSIQKTAPLSAASMPGASMVPPASLGRVPSVIKRSTAPGATAGMSTALEEVIIDPHPFVVGWTKCQLIGTQIVSRIARPVFALAATTAAAAAAISTVTNLDENYNSIYKVVLLSATGVAAFSGILMLRSANGANELQRWLRDVEERREARRRLSEYADEHVFDVVEHLPAREAALRTAAGTGIVMERDDEGEGRVSYGIGRPKEAADDRKEEENIDDDEKEHDDKVVVTVRNGDRR